MYHLPDPTVESAGFAAASDADLADSQHFQACFNGPNRPAACP